MELSIVMPCRNEAETVAGCVSKARSFLDTHNVDGEVVVADNGSTDGSQLLAQAAGARVIDVPTPGYGNALLGGIQAAQGQFVVMGDADDSYDFTALAPFLTQLRQGVDLVVGNRFRGGIEPGAMPTLHRYLGNPVLSFVGRLLFGSPVRDFHCGLRAFDRQTILDLHLQSSGMEFASEIIVRATLSGLKVVEVPTTLSPDGRSKPPHLRTWRDGWRHLRFLLLYSPRWLFLYPGIALVFISLLLGIPVSIHPQHIGGVTLDVDSLIAASALFVIGFQSVLFAILTKAYAIEEGFLPPDPRMTRLLKVVTLERGLLAGAVLGLLGVAGFVAAVLLWHQHNFGALNPDTAIRLIVPSTTALIVSCQVMLASLFGSILGIRRIAQPSGGSSTQQSPEHAPELSGAERVSRTPTATGS